MTDKPFEDSLFESKEYYFKFFGDDNVLDLAIQNIKKIAFDNVDISYQNNFGDHLIKLTFINLNEEQQTSIVSEFYQEIKSGVYATTDLTLSEVLLQLLIVKKYMISTAESFTGGRIVSEIVKNSGASKAVLEGIVAYSEDSKMQRLNVDEKTLNEVGAVSSQVAYQMCADLLKNPKCDIAISTTGLAGPNGDGSGKPVGLNYIAIGRKYGIDVYKFITKGSREDITETAVNNALFLAINKIKNS